MTYGRQNDPRESSCTPLLCRTATTIGATWAHQWVGRRQPASDYSEKEDGMPELWKPRLGACYLGAGRCRFRVWAPRAERVELHVVGPGERLVPLEARARGYFETLLEDVEPGT